jgi:hypothetical protein
MWRRFRRRSFGPRRPAVFEEQWPLVIITLLVIAAGVAVVVAGLLSN